MPYKIGDVVRPKKGQWIENDYRIRKISKNSFGEELYMPNGFIGLTEDGIEGLVSELKEEDMKKKYIVTAKAGYWFSEFEFEDMTEAMKFIDDLFDHFR